MRRLLGRRVGATAIALGLSLTGCGTAELHAADGGPLGALLAREAPPDPPPGTAAEASEALRVWRDFPVDAARRPIVLSGSDAHEGSDYTGIPGLVFADPQDLPPGPAEATGYPVIGAGDALAVLRRDIHHVRRAERTHVTVTGMRIGTGRFWTDRGLQRLPARIVDYRITDAVSGRRPTGTAYVLAVAPPARWGPVGRDDAGIDITPDGMTLLVEAYSREPFDGPCRTVFDGVATETRTAVAFDVRPRQAGPGRDVSATAPHLGAALVHRGRRGALAAPVGEPDRRPGGEQLVPVPGAPLRPADVGARGAEVRGTGGHGLRAGGVDRPRDAGGLVGLPRVRLAAPARRARARRDRGELRLLLGHSRVQAAPRVVAPASGSPARRRAAAPAPRRRR